MNATFIQLDHAVLAIFEQAVDCGYGIIGSPRR